MQQEINTLQTQINSLDAQLAAPGINSATQSALLQERSTLISQQAGLQDQLQNNQAQAATTITPTVLTPATVPASPTGTSPVKLGLLGLGAGLAVGIVLALLFEYLDDSILTSEHLEAELNGEVRLLGTVPEYRWRKRPGSPNVITLADTSSMVAESYRGLRTALHFAGADKPGSVLQVVAPTSGEGASTTAANLAVLIARAGQWVVLIDANLRHPRLNELFGLDNTIGLTNVLRGDAPLAEATKPVPVPGLDRVSLLPAGPPVHGASELLASPRTEAIVRALQDGGATVILDCPPLLAASDGLALAESANAVLLVTSARGGTRRRIRRAVALLRQANAPVVGAVLNRAGKSSVSEYETNGKVPGPLDLKPLPQVIQA